MKNKILQSIGKKGGLKTLEKHGREHFSKIAKDMQANKKQKDDQNQITV